MDPIFVGSPWQGQSPTRPDPTTYRHADGGDYRQLVYEISQASGPVSLSLTIDGLATPGTPVYLKTTDHVGYAQANALATTNVLGLINSDGKIQVNGTLTLPTANWDFITGQSGGLTTGTWYWLSDTTAGKLITVEPEILVHYSVAVLYALSPTEALIQVNAPDFIVESLITSNYEPLTVVDIVSVNHVAVLSVSDTVGLVDGTTRTRETFWSTSTTLAIVDSATGVDVPPAFIYFENGSLISKSNIDGSGIVSIGTNPQGTVTRIAIDSAGATARLGQFNTVLGQIRLSQLMGTINSFIFYVNQAGSTYTLRYLTFAGGVETISSTVIESPPTGFTLDDGMRWIYQYGMAGLWLTQYETDGSAGPGIGNPYVPVGTPGGIALNLTGMNPVIYLGDNGVIQATINYADLSHLVSPVTVYTPTATVGQIACDPVSGYLFVMDGKLLRRMGLNGEAPITLLNVGAVVNSLFVDSNQQKLYYSYNNKVVQSNYDGSGAVNVLAAVDSNSGCTLG